MLYQKTKWSRFEELEVEDDAIKKIVLITAGFFVFFLVLGLVGQAFAQPKIEGVNVRYTDEGVEKIGYLAYGGKNSTGLSPITPRPTDNPGMRLKIF